MASVKIHHDGNVKKYLYKAIIYDKLTPIA